MKWRKGLVNAAHWGMNVRVLPRSKHEKKHMTGGEHARTGRFAFLLRSENPQKLRGVKQDTERTWKRGGGELGEEAPGGWATFVWVMVGG